jgi:alkanesulfonate monooxygenase SsuD/methylene tetrahydromethanopterin reductase-like flavin-dependent oxidoreductase (luciferase family)
VELGLMLPLAPPYSPREEGLLAAAPGLGFSTFWLQEWPVGVGIPGTVDHGSGHDPLIYGAHLAQRFGPRLDAIGLAALRLDYRPPSVVARAAVSAQVLGGSRLRLGLGCRTSRPETVAQAAEAWQQIRHFLRDGPSDEFVVPAGFEPPPMYLASGNLDLWGAIAYEAEGLLSGQRDPRKLASLATQLRSERPGLEVALHAFFRIDPDDPRALRLTERNGLVVGRDRLAQFVEHWREIDVTRLIYAPTETPSERQLELMAECVRG